MPVPDLLDSLYLFNLILYPPLLLYLDIANIPHKECGPTHCSKLWLATHVGIAG